ncbi:hypothetical protein ANO11243_085770 [Dothideomycetidae sp. 11243]|nr:hypothetical protein ANO11243_085770 [fungal sp. No.11243]
MARAAPEPATDNVSLPSQILVVDPGSYSIKAGLVASSDNAETDSLPECAVIPNCIARSRAKQTYIGSSLSQCTDFGEMQFKRPVERGYIVNWDLQRAIFEHEFLDPKAKLYCDPTDTSLLMAEPPNAPTALQSNADQIIFEEFSFAAASRINAACLNAFTPLPAELASPSHPSPLSDPPLPTEILLLIDSGHSSTLITPLLRGQPIHSATRRINVGGKHISNYLAELISLRHFSLIDEPHIISQIKEDACFISSDFPSDLDRTWRGPRSDRRVPDPSLVVDYVLPDYTTLHRGILRPHQPKSAAATTAAAGTEGEEVFTLANERFTPPELLFNPQDISQPESGIPATVMQVLSQLPAALHGPLLANVVLTGGSALLPGFVDRLQSELRALAPSRLVVRVARAADPVGNAFRGGARIAAHRPWLENVVVTRAQYEEHGEGWVRREFARRRVVEDWGAASAAARAAFTQDEKGDAAMTDGA